MRETPEWLTKEVVLEIHVEVIDLSGGSHGLRDEGLFKICLVTSAECICI